MPDEPLYDPDRMVPDDLDCTDLDVARAYLDDPTTEKLVDDLGRSFREMPADYQQRELDGFLTQLAEHRERFATDLSQLDADCSIRSTLQELLDSIDKHMETTKLRMLELD